MSYQWHRDHANVYVSIGSLSCWELSCMEWLRDCFFLLKYNFSVLLPIVKWFWFYLCLVLHMYCLYMYNYQCERVFYIEIFLANMWEFIMGRNLINAADVRNVLYETAHFKLYYENLIKIF